MTVYGMQAKQVRTPVSLFTPNACSIKLDALVAISYDHLTERLII